MNAINRLRPLFLLLPFAFLLLPSLAFADGILIPVPPPDIAPRPIPRLAVKSHRVEVRITDQVATTSVDQVFINDFPRDLEATYMFPLPEDAAISSFSMWAEGEKLEGRILSREEARSIYETIVRTRRDPALLEYVGRGAFQASVFPVPANGEKRIALEYAQVLTQEADMVRYRYQLRTESYSSRPLQSLTITVRISSQQPITTVFSPSHDVAVARRSDREMEVSFEASNVLPKQDFELVYGVSQEGIGATLVSHMGRDGDGYFLLLLAPQYNLRLQEPVAKDVTFVLDTSGSMAGQKIQQAKDAVRYVLENLNPQDRFNVVAFHTAVTRFADSMQPASRGAIDRATTYVNGLRAAGGTNISEALQTALQGAEAPSPWTGREGVGSRPHTVLFLTDGVPTAGITEVPALLNQVAETAPANVRIFAFGVGYDVNTVLLDGLAERHRGWVTYVRPQDDLEEKVSGFYRKIQTPVLSDLALDFGPRRARDLYPTPLPDMDAEGQLVVVGRYSGSGSVDLTLRGTSNGEPRNYGYTGLTFAASPDNSFIPRLWATRKVAYLLNQIRLYGRQQEILEEVIALSTRYGIVTPYTSFLVEEPTAVPMPAAARSAELAGRLAAAPATGQRAVEASQDLWSYQGAARAPEAPGGRVETVGDKTFVLRGQVWTDTGYQPDAAVTKLAFASPEYFGLLDSHPEAGQYMALGEQVLFCLDSGCYQTTP